MDPKHFDVLIVGAGLSGIGAGYHLQTKCPGKSYAILESRDRLGGTWDLFKYPGIRSDSDMYTLGFSFRPWTSPKAIADGPSILKYLEDTAAEYGIDRKMRFGHKVVSAEWSSGDARWTLDVETDAGLQKFSCNFLFTCAGYYKYEAGYTPDFEGADDFEGEIVHPQQWTEDIAYEGKRVVVIGSGATAMTLVPELAKDAANVTMLQRSPTYVVSAPQEDPLANWLRGRIPEMPAYMITRWKNVMLSIFFYQYARRFPAHAKKGMVGLAQKALGEEFDVSHFTPSYDPWDQRVCLVPDSDLFRAIKAGDVDVVTDHIEKFTKTGIQLRSGAHLDADLIVTATGLQLQFLGGMALTVDGESITPSTKMAYKGMMVSDVPNLALAIGYTNASWTLKCDLTCEYVCRLLQHMDKTGTQICVPRRDPSVEEEPLIDFSSSYVQRAIAAFPRQGSKAPWKVYQNYVLDLLTLRRGRLEDGILEFSRATGRTVRATQPVQSELN